jgi:hypothetical protein
VADITAIRTALASQIAAHTGLRAEADPKDQVSPPVALIVPGNPLVRFGETMDAAITISLSIALILSDAAPTDKTQRALDSYLGIGAGEETSMAAAIMTDISLGGTVHWCVPTTVTSYGRIEISGVIYFGARLGVSIGAI